MVRQPKPKFKAGDFVQMKENAGRYGVGVVSTYPGSITWEEPSPYGYAGFNAGHYTYQVVLSEGQRILKEHDLAKVRKPKGYRENTGYRPCACRDCMETAIGGPGSYCHECEAAGCADYQGRSGMSQECQAAGAYGGEDPIEEHEFLSARHRGGKRRSPKPSGLGALVADINKLTR